MEIQVINSNTDVTELINYETQFSELNKYIKHTFIKDELSKNQSVIDSIVKKCVFYMSLMFDDFGHEENKFLICKLAKAICVTCKYDKIIFDNKQYVNLILPILKIGKNMGININKAFFELDFSKKIKSKNVVCEFKKIISEYENIDSDDESCSSEYDIIFERQSSTDSENSIEITKITPVHDNEIVIYSNCKSENQTKIKNIKKWEELLNHDSVYELFFDKNFYFDEKVTFMPNLEILNLPDSFNQPLINLPQSLKYLTLGNNFNSKILLPSNLKCITFGRNFNQHIDNYPESLTHITFGENFDQQLLDHQIPKNIKSIKINKMNYANKQNKLSKSSLIKNLTK